MRPRKSLRLATTTLLGLGLLGSTLLAAPAEAGPERRPDPATYTATVETPANFDDEAGGDADADDPAIWVHRHRPTRSVVLGALKNGGLDAYDLRGRVLQHIDTPPAPGEDLAAGRFNNVDILGNLAVVTDRGRDRLRAYRISPRGAAAGNRVLTDVTDPRAPRLFSATEAAVEEQETGYGLALWAFRGETYAVVSRRHTSTIALFRLRVRAAGVSYVRVATLRLPEQFRLSDGTSWRPCDEPGVGPQVEGMVVDGKSDVLYAAQEDVGIWRIPLHGAKESSGRRGADFGEAQLVDRVREFGRAATYDAETEECSVSDTPHPDSGRHISADAEGLTVERRRGQRPVLIASSQGDSTFVRYTLSGRYLSTFSVVDGRFDSVQNSDGAAVSTAYLGPHFPGGLLVVHDGENTPAEVADGETRANTNFKFIPWGAHHR